MTGVAGLRGKYRTTPIRPLSAELNAEGSDNTSQARARRLTYEKPARRLRNSHHSTSPR
jgi:hypothetical protein